MLHEQSSSSDAVGAQITQGGAVAQKIMGGGTFSAVCRDADGNIKWTAEKHNLVVNVGLKDMNDKYFTGSGYTATWYLGLYGAALSNDPAATDTAASHAGWTEVTPYSNATRPAATFSAATTADPSVITNASSPAVFNVNATETVGGAFLISDNTKGGTTGVLFSAADFDAPGDRNVANGDTITVTYTFELDAA
jgi:uncharacterized protein (DUF39 family)